MTPLHADELGLRYRIGPDSPRYRTGKTRDANGYVILSSKEWGPNRGRREHQVVAERMLGRPLLPNEVVHHRNHDKADNRPENLEVLARAEHNRRHGSGRLLACTRCGAERWYSPTGYGRLANPDRYVCGPCGGRWANRR